MMQYLTFIILKMVKTLAAPAVMDSVSANLAHNSHFLKAAKPLAVFNRKIQVKNIIAIV